MNDERKKMEGINLQELFYDARRLRVECNKRRQLLTIITVALCAVIYGADIWVYVEKFGKVNRG